MLPREKRVSKEIEIREILACGKRIRGVFFDLIFLKKEREKSAFCIFCPSRVSKRAIKRNRIKRLISEAATSLYRKIPEGSRIVIIAKKDFSDKKKEFTIRELGPMMEKISKAR